MNFTSIIAAALIPYEITVWLKPTLQIIMAIVSIFAIVIILMQKSADNSIGAIGGQETENYAGKNKSKTKESLWKKLTIVALTVMLVLSVVFFLTFLEI
ncbi:MAG: preprotein translocase subunit SecG [Clostridia bacterium]